MNRRKEDRTSDICTYHHAKIIMLGSPRNREQTYTTFWGFCYFIIFICKAIGYVWIRFIKKKCKALCIFQNLVIFFFRQYGIWVCIFHTDFWRIQFGLGSQIFWRNEDNLGIFCALCPATKQIGGMSQVDNYWGSPSYYHRLLPAAYPIGQSTHNYDIHQELIANSFYCSSKYSYSFSNLEPWRSA